MTQRTKTVKLLNGVRHESFSKVSGVILVMVLMPDGYSPTHDPGPTIVLRIFLFTKAKSVSTHKCKVDVVKGRLRVRRP